MRSTPSKKRNELTRSRDSTGALRTVRAGVSISDSPPNAQTVAAQPQAMVAALGSLALLDAFRADVKRLKSSIPLFELSALKRDSLDQWGPMAHVEGDERELERTSLLRRMK